MTKARVWLAVGLSLVVVSGCTSSGGAGDAGAAATGGVPAGGQGGPGGASQVGGSGGSAAGATGGVTEPGSGGTPGPATGTGGRDTSASGGRGPGSGGAPAASGGAPAAGGGPGAGGSGGAGLGGAGLTTGGGGAPADGPGVFVAVGYGSRTIRSTDDGQTWTDDASLVQNGGDDNNLLRAVVWGAGQFVAIGYRVMTSPDGQSWQDHGVTSLNQWFGSIVYAQNQYVGNGGYGLHATSPDALTWKDHSIDTAPAHAGNGLVYDPAHQQFACANDNGVREYSADGKTWTASTGSTGSKTTQLAVGNGVVVSAGGTAVVISQDGGKTWSDGGALTAKCQGLIFAQEHFTAFASGHVMTSDDGLAWADHAVSGFSTSAVAFGNGTYVSTDGMGLRRSSDGLTWGTAVTPSSTNGLYWVTFGPGS